MALTTVLLVALAAAPNGGSVVHVTAARAYLDRGAEDGLSVGQVVAMKRKGASCTVEWVAPHAASCVGPVSEGDRFVLPRVAPPSEPPRLPAPPTAAELARRRAAIEAAPSAPLVEHEGGGDADAVLGRRMRASAELAHATWAAFETSDGAFHEERVDVSIRGAPVIGPFRVFAELTALRRTAPSNVRFRPGEDNQLYVREAELSAREPGDPWALSAGRLWPWHAPGAPVMDGAQAGWRSREGGAEVGAFGGGLPAPDTLEPRTDAWTGGAYWAFRRADDDAAIPFLRHEGRLAMVNVPGLGQLVEAEALVHGSLGRALDMSADLRGRLDEPGLTAARFDFGGRPLEQLRVGGGFRWQDDEANAIDEVPAVGSRRADASVTWEPSRYFTLGGAAGHAAELSTTAGRSYAGPELGFPRLFGDAGGLSLGYQEELGFLSGRAGWLQSSLSPSRTVRVLTRLSYFEDRSGSSTDGEPATFREVGLYGAVDTRLLEWLSLSTSLLARAGLPTLGGELEYAAAVPAGIYGTLGLKGEL